MTKRYYAVRNLNSGLLVPSTKEGVDYEDALDVAYRLGSAGIPTETVVVRTEKI